jgi:hypothetical protein
VYKSFAVEFGPRFIGLLFRNAINSTGMMVLNSELGVSQARRELDGDNDFAKASIAALEKIYRETNSLPAANRSRAATGNDRPAAPE